MRPRFGAVGETLVHFGFGYIAAIFDAVAVFAAAFAAPALYRFATLEPFPNLAPVLEVGSLVALLVVLSTTQRGGYSPSNYAETSGQLARALRVWHFALFGALAVTFATRTTSDFSRGPLLVFYPVGLISLGMARRALVDGLAVLRRAGLAPPRRFMVIGFEQRIKAIMAREDRGEAAAEILSAIALRENEAFFADDLELAAAAVRMKRPDDVILALPWSRPELIEACMDTFLRTPTEIHLGTDSVLDRFIDDKLAYFGAFAALKVTRPALSRLERLEKRAFDFVTASLALIVLMPFFLLVALVIRLDSPGPALFRQKRYGFNQEPFRIFKFRTMTTLDDGRHIQQATRADPRITRVGAFLRKYSIDELPQLLNVLTGEMSIVGPRPHALAHDQRYVRRLAGYARRHNVKPGITGWAQVSGHRGEISSDEMMQARLEHDLYYVDNWSFGLDVKIIILTIVSPRAHANAY